MPVGAGGRAGADGSLGPTRGSAPPGPGRTAAPGPSHRLTTGATSYASRLMLSRWRGEMLSDVMFPPYPPQPRVIAGSSPVDRPTDPCVVGVLTTIRKAGFFSPNSRMT